MRSLQDRIQDANVRASQWLADGNSHEEQGVMDKATICFERSGFWRDRYNLLTNQSEKKAPGK